MEQMKLHLVRLLNIHAVSGHEEPVRDYLHSLLVGMLDTVYIDSYGNLLGEKRCGSGQGATVLLSAHMDTITGVPDYKFLNEENGIITAELPNGYQTALGADDRAGIAIILKVLRNALFDGILKVAFTVKEEVGRKGSNNISLDFFNDIDLAIVVDRRGSRDIVTCCSGMAFCSNEVGHFMENVSKSIGMDWVCIEGGISDACTYAQHGVNTINLSAGYMHEHTNKEFVSISDMEDTVKLILQTLVLINEHSHRFSSVPHENKWMQEFVEMDRIYEEGVWGEVFDPNGAVFIYEIDGTCIIQQGSKEIAIERRNLRDFIDQIKNA